MDTLSPDELASVVSLVTSRSCGMRFVPGDVFIRGEAVPGRLFIFPFNGKQRCSLLLSCDRPTSIVLASRLAQPGAVINSSELVEARIRDLLGRLAAGLESALDARRAIRAGAPPHRDPVESVPLRSDDLPSVRLWVVSRTTALSTADFVSDVARDFQ